MIARPIVALIDLDGPVLDVRRRYFRVHTAAADGLLGCRALSAEEYWRAKRERQTLATILGRPDGHPDLARYAARWRQLIESADQLGLDEIQPGAHDALRRFRVVPKLVLVTMRSSPSGVEVTLDRLSLRPLVDHVEIIPHSQGSKQPAFTRLGTSDPVATVVIGDTEIDIEAAQALHFRTVAVSNGIRTPQWLAELGADAVVADLGGAADLLLGDPAVSGEQPCK